MHLKTILPLCLASEFCLTRSDHKDLVQKIRGQLDKQLTATKPLEFLSGRVHPEIFLINGEYKTAVTGNRVGDTIYINIDFLYRDAVGGGRIPMSIASAMGLIVHELGHHQGITDHDYLDLVGAHVKAFALSTMDILYVDRYLDGYTTRPPRIGLTAIHSKSSTGDALKGAESTLLFADEFKVNNLTQNITRTLATCPATHNFPEGKTIGYRLYNLHFDGYRDTKDFRFGRYYRLVASVELYCEHFEDRSYPVRFDVGSKLIVDLYLLFDGNENSSGWIYKPEKTIMKLLLRD